MRKYFLYSFIVLFISSCANYKVNYSSTAKKWSENTPENQNGKIKHSMFMIGNVGTDEETPSLPSLELLKSKLSIRLNFTENPKHKAFSMQLQNSHLEPVRRFYLSLKIPGRAVN